ncbi:MAG: PQQ-binding-like beta-propeller repeat protein [Planctomycetota bacterium]
MHLIRAQCLPVRLLTTLLLAALAAEAIPQPRAAAGLNELEARFQKQMSGAKMLGFYTVSDAPAGVPAREESYTIQRVTKLGKDRWRFDARIEYDKRSVEMPVVVEVRWAGDTPMIQVTDMKIPMLGTYTARVLIYRGQYAGMWSGKGHGGHMYGRIVPAAGQEAGPDGNTKDKEVRGASLRAPGKTAWWNAWRGRDGTGVARGSNPPTEWSEDRNIRWKAAIPGLGSSSPIVWKDRVYVTTAIETDELGEPSAGRDPPEPVRRRERRGGRGRRGGRRGGFMNRPPPTRIHEFVVLALDRRDGEIVWRTEVKKAVPHEAGHRTSSQASNSPVTDGEHIYAYFGSRGLHCLDMEGNVQWSKDFGLMRTRMGFGEGSSLSYRSIARPATSRPRRFTATPS